MKKNQITPGINGEQKEVQKSTMKAGCSGTDPKKVRQEIQQDVSKGVGDMTSREAGSMRD
ncbi:hypothetical protein QRD89_07490 [Halobacillus sp. ACCC02827]|uniref:hypothetical protein n=1 Tax=unclassified Halobacillus TaxID=2636472 RepID=UPI0007809949|nr:MULTISPECIES: hypothetical protein [unclassified Halobacillus]WJE17739.1 hypothetical protein QRD89_07490 [Halobacillus sp. ACCC02827]